MDTRQVRYFLAVVEHGGFGRAAAALNVAQPTMSQSVKTLERDLGAELFHRASHGVVLSAAGRAFLGPARQLMRDVALAGESIGGQAERDTLEIVAATPLGTHPGAGLVGSFVAAHPGVLVSLDRVDDEQLLGRVRDGVSELGLVHLPVARLGLSEIPLGSHELVLIYPPGTGVPPGRVRLSTLDNENLLAVPRGNPPRVLVESVLRAAGVRTRVVVESGQRDLLLELVLAGAGAAFVTDAAATVAEQRGAVVRRAEPALHLRYGLVHRTGELSPAAQAFVAHALRTA